MSNNRDEHSTYSRSDDPAVANEEFDPLAEYEPYAVTAAHSAGVAHQVHTARRPDWEPGNPCPQCGSGLIVSSYIGTEIARHHEGEITTLGAGDRFGVIEYQCADCTTVLYTDVTFDLWTTLYLD